MHAKCPFGSGSWDPFAFCALKFVSQSNLVPNALHSVLILQLVQERIFYQVMQGTGEASETCEKELAMASEVILVKLLSNTYSEVVVEHHSVTPLAVLSENSSRNKCGNAWHSSGKAVHRRCFEVFQSQCVLEAQPTKRRKILGRFGTVALVSDFVSEQSIPVVPHKAVAEVSE